jgi:anti-sigma regulatory factor (Ser/Thr protein kinase)/anti-anti-sigma regulatory factor
LNILSSDNRIIKLPSNFNFGNMYPFINAAIDEKGDAKYKEIVFDFSELKFIDPVAVVVLSNLIEYLHLGGVNTNFKGLKTPLAGVIFLDDAGFFKHYMSLPLRPHALQQDTTLPLKLVESPRATSYLYQDLIPWLARRLMTTSIALSTVRVCLEEIFHNIKDHSGVGMGWVFAQHFPKLKEVHIAISDFGNGIPANVRKIRPTVTGAEALSLAIQEGFTTKSNVQNRGAGLAVLTRYVTLRNGGGVFITSGNAYISVVPQGEVIKTTPRERFGTYPGTLIHVILKTDTLETLYEDIEPEEFSW